MSKRKFKTVKTASDSPVAHQRLVRHTVAARVNSMESEKLYLQNLHAVLRDQTELVRIRIVMLTRGIAAEKASVPNTKLTESGG